MKGVNSPSPTTAEIVGGVYNAVPPTLQDGQGAALQLDVNGKLITSGSSGGVSNVNIADVAGSPPALTNPLPVELSDGTNAVGTPGNPLSVNVITGGGSNASVGLTGAAAPTSATEVGIIVAGNLQGVSAANPMPVSGPLTDAQLRATPVPVSGTVTANAGTNLNTSALALDATLTGGTQKTKIVDTGGTNVASVSAAGAVKVDGSAATQPVSGTITATQGTAAASTAGWPIVTGDVAESTAAWTSATALNTAVTQAVKNYNTVILTLNQGSTIAGGVVTFEVSDTIAFTNAYTIFGVPVNVLISANSNPLSTYTLVATTNQAFVFDVSGWAAFRVRLSTVITGSATVNVGVQANAGAVSHSLFAKIDFNSASYFSSNSVPITLADFADASASGNIRLAATAGGGARALGVGIIGYTGAASVAANSVGIRTPNIFKTVNVTSATAGNSAVRTPTSGKKFRLMKFQITGSNLAATAATVVTLSFQDNVTGITIGTYDVLLPAIATATSVLLGGVQDISCGWIDLNNGYLSLVANNVLNLNVSAAPAGATGSYRINVCGTEE